MIGLGDPSGEHLKSLSKALPLTHLHTPTPPTCLQTRGGPEMLAIGAREVRAPACVFTHEVAVPCRDVLANRGAHRGSGDAHLSPPKSAELRSTPLFALLREGMLARGFLAPPARLNGNKLSAQLEGSRADERRAPAAACTTAPAPAPLGFELCIEARWFCGGNGSFPSIFFWGVSLSCLFFLTKLPSPEQTGNRSLFRRVRIKCHLHPGGV